MTLPPLNLWYSPAALLRMRLRPLHAELQRRYTMAARIRRAFEVCR